MTIETDEMCLGKISQSKADGSIPFELQSRFGKEENYSIVPWSIYFFYIRIDRDGKLTVKHYLLKDNAEIKPDDLDVIIKDMALTGRPSDYSNYIQNKDKKFEYIGNNFSSVFFDRVSYVVFFLDEAHWKFLENKDGRPMLEFLTEKLGKPFEENFAFSDATLHTIKMPRKDKDGKPRDPDTRQAASLVNHFSTKDGWAIGGEHDKEGKGKCRRYTWNIWTRVTFANPSADDSGLTVIFDPGGTNGGPPQPPPVKP